MKLSCAVAILLFSLSGCVRKSIETPRISQQEYDIYSAIIDTNFCWEYGPDLSATVVVTDRTIRGWVMGEEVHSSLHPARSRADTTYSLRWFSRTSDWDAFLKNYRSVCNDTIPLSRERLRTEFPLAHPDATIDPNPLSTFSFSRAGFNVDSTEALVMVRSHDGWGEHRYFVLMRKENNRWTFVQSTGLYGGEWHMEGYWIIPPSTKQNN